jgi:hypothetical protein
MHASFAVLQTFCRQLGEKQDPGGISNICFPQNVSDYVRRLMKRMN